MLVRYIPLILLFTLIVVIAYGFFFINPAELQQTSSAPALPNICNEGVVKSCNTDIGCSGERVCLNGAWTGCITKKVCSPGERAQCIENFCSTGYKICNECGTGYGGCINSK